MRHIKRRTLLAGLVLLLVILLSAACEKSKTDPPVVPKPNPIVDSLVACYKFNNDFTDSTGKNTAGVSSGALSFIADRNGNNSGALGFGASAKLTLNGIIIPRPNTVTMAFWIKPALTAGLQYYILALQGQGIAAAQTITSFHGVVSTPSTNSTTASIADNNWHHLTITYNGTDIKFYVDGILKATTNHPGNITTTTYDYVLGFHNGAYWQGNLDDLRIYKTVLTDAEILQLSKL